MWNIKIELIHWICQYVKKKTFIQIHTSFPFHHYHHVKNTQHMLHVGSDFYHIATLFYNVRFSSIIRDNVAVQHTRTQNDIKQWYSIGKIYMKLSITLWLIITPRKNFHFHIYDCNVNVDCMRDLNKCFSKRKMRKPSHAFGDYISALTVSFSMFLLSFFKLSLEWEWMFFFSCENKSRDWK